MAVGALVRTTLPRYWRYWLAGAASFLTFKACKPLPQGRVTSLQAMRDKVRDATGENEALTSTLMTLLIENGLSVQVGGSRIATRRAWTA